jgi:hypothetical protein
VACDHDTLLFSDIRYKRDNIDNQEVNLGLGITTMMAFMMLIAVSGRAMPCNTTAVP